MNPIAAYFFINRPKPGGGGSGDEPPYLKWMWYLALFTAAVAVGGAIFTFFI